MMKTLGTGYLTANPELKDSDGTVFATFTLATHEYRKDATGKTTKFTHFLDCIAWDSGARTIVDLCHKGDRLAVVASPRQRKWVDAETGKNRSRIVFRVEEFELLTYKRGEAEDAGPEPTSDE